MNDVINRIHSDSRLANFIEASRTPLRIACNTDSHFPLIVPLWFLFDGEAFWCVTHKDAKLLKHLYKDQRVGFEIANNEPRFIIGYFETYTLILVQMFQQFCILVCHAPESFTVKKKPEWHNQREMAVGVTGNAQGSA